MNCAIFKLTIELQDIETFISVIGVNLKKKLKGNVDCKNNDV